MRSFSRLRSLAAPLLVLLAAALLTTACDTAEEDTIVLGTAQDNPISVTYEFDYNTNTAIDGELGVTSGTRQDDLASDLDFYGYTRDDVVSARVTNVEIRTSVGSSKEIKLYDYVQNISVYLGQNDSGVLIAGPEPIPNTEIYTFNESGGNVTDIVKSGQSPAFMLMEVDPNTDTPGAIEAIVTYRVEVRPRS